MFCQLPTHFSNFLGRYLVLPLHWIQSGNFVSARAGICSSYMPPPRRPPMGNSVGGCASPAYALAFYVMPDPLLPPVAPAGQRIVQADALPPMQQCPSLPTCDLQQSLPPHLQEACEAAEAMAK